MTTRRGALAGLGAGLAASLLGGCAARPDGRLRFGLPTAPATLDPRHAADAMSYRLVRLLHRAPVDFDAAGEPRADLAEWTMAAPTRYRFELRDDARFDDGSPVTAADVAATYRSVLDPATASPHRGSLANIHVIEVVDARRLDFVLTRPDPLFPGTLVVGVLAARDLARDAGRDRWSRSCGAFTLEARSLDDTVLLRRRRDAALVEFVTVKDHSVRALKLIGGELDIAQGNLAPELHAWLAARPGLRGLAVPGSTFSYLGFNLDDPLAGRIEVRRAIAHAIDRAAIVEYLFDGRARLASTLFPPEHWAGTRDLAAPAHDPSAARRLLAAAGFGRRRPRLEYKTSSDHFRQRIATVLRQQLDAVGIDLDIVSYDWGTFYGDVSHGRFQLYGLSWVGLRLPDVFRYAFHSTSRPPAGANRGHYRSARLDGLVERAERAGARAARVGLYHEIAALLLDDLPYVPLWFEDQLVIMRDDIEGYATDASGSFDALATATRRPRHAG
ncbi:MAG: ABC transporter substrate-binding protein [Gammaproteobacteria bacterium]|nr:ABC transporter substrate-binding protein [Gammaproteobacteria bacterium]